MDRLLAERQFHDRQARDRAGYFRRHPDRLRFDPRAYLDHETWIRPAFARLGDVAGLRVLDFGCGHGMAGLVLARWGADVTAFDLSAGYMAEAGARAAASGTRMKLVQADGERLPFADGSFDRVWGNAVLHHLDLAVAGPELYRVLRPGGVAVFCEPWGENPLLRWARRRLPYSSKERTPDEAPLTSRQLAELERVFGVVEVTGHQLLAMARRVLPACRLTAGLDWCDGRVLAYFPALRRFCRYVVLTLRR